jgi:SAM-dependent methyltransferase
MSDPVEVFTRIYRDKVWGAGSGGGSDPERAKPYCDFVTAYIKKHKPKRVLDIGCGDLRVANAIDFGAAYYIGIDAANAWPKLEKSKTFEILHGDALTMDLPPADLLLCKEVLQHLTNAQVQALLRRTAHYPRRLFTSMVVPTSENLDIETGETRAVDLRTCPFYQPCITVFTYGQYIVQELVK